MAEFTPAESQAIQDRARVFVADAKIGRPVAGVETFLQRNSQRLLFWLRNQNRGQGLFDWQLNEISGVCQVYEAIVGLNQGYSADFRQRVGSYLESAHDVLDRVPSGNRPFSNSRALARARKDAVLGREEYFWNVYLEPTAKLIKKIGQIMVGEQEGRVLETADSAFYRKLKAGELNVGELNALMKEGEYMVQRTLVNMRFPQD